MRGGQLELASSLEPIALLPATAETHLSGISQSPPRRFRFFQGLISFETGSIPTIGGRLFTLMRALPGRSGGGS